MYKLLLGTRKTLVDLAKEQDVLVEEISTAEIEQCSDCSIWTNKNRLTSDMWNNPQCPLCKEYYGL